MPRFEVRCHEWGDDRDYHWTYCKTKDEAQRIVEKYDNFYEHMYYLEVDDKGNLIPPH